MDQAPQDEQQLSEQQQVVTSENIQELLASKNFKQRTLAYQRIDEFPQFVGLLQNETMAVALEAALDSLVNFNGVLTNVEVAGLYPQLCQSKASIKTKLSEVIDKAFSNDELGTLRGLSLQFAHKNPKVVLGCVNKVNSLVSANLEAFRSKERMRFLAEEICAKLDALLSSSDKDVKSESSALSLTLYRIFYDDLLKYLENVKPIILKDLKESFKQVEVPRAEVRLSGLDFDHPDWKERLNAMNFIKENITKMSNLGDVIPVLSRRTKDPNISVVVVTVECIKAGKIVSPDCVRGMMERFKDKKAPLTQLIIDTVKSTMPDVNILIDGLSSKNPDVKIGILECLKLYVISKRIGEIGNMLDDGSASVRKAAADVLSQVDDVSELTESQKSKLRKKQPVHGENAPKASDLSKKMSGSPSKMVISQEPTNLRKTAEKRPYATRPNADTKLSNFASTSDQASKTKVCELFSEKYPQLFDKDWNKRLAFIQENKEKLREEGMCSILLFLVGSKETNLTVLKELMSILLSFDDLSGIETDLCCFLNSKITESKLKDGIVELFKKIDSTVAIQSILQSLEQNRVGKKFVCLLDVLSEVVAEQSEEIDKFLEKTKVFGMQEKKALSDFTDHYRSLGSAAHPSFASASNTGASSAVKSSISPSNAHEDKRIGTRRDSVADTSKSDAEPRKSLSIKIFRDNTDFAGPVNNVFTPEFLNVFQTDPFVAVGMLEKVDVCRFAHLIILLYCQFSLPSPYFNSLILHLISRRFILGDNDAHTLVSFLLGHSMDSEMDLMDRIYPATKLYKVLRAFPSDLSLNAIFNLVRKYKDLDGLNLRDIEAAMKNNDDFIAFSLNIDRIIGLKNELRCKIDQNASLVDTLYQNEAAGGSSGVPHVGGATHTPTVPPSTNVDGPNNGFGREKLMEEKLSYQSIMKDENDLDELEESIIIGRSLSEESSQHSLSDGANTSHISASVVKAPSIANRDSLLTEDYDKQQPASGDGGADANGPQPGVINTTSFHCDDINFNIPSSKIVDADLSYEIERSLENISISTTPMKKRRNFSEIEDVLTKLSSEDIDISTEGLHKLMEIIVENPSSISFSSNTVVSSILIQMMTRYQNLDYRGTALNVLLRFTQNTTFCSCLRFETLKSVHADLVPLVKDQNTVADILINLCLNCELQVLRVYFELLEDANETLMKLIWRHSKKVRYTSVDTAATVIKIVDRFFEEKRDFLRNADNIVIKVCLLHLKECVAAFSDNLKQFGISRTTERIINLLLSGRDFNVEETRSIFREEN